MKKNELLLSFSLAAVSLALTVSVTYAAESDVAKDDSAIIISQNSQIAKISGIKLEKIDSGLQLFLETSNLNAVKSKTIIDGKSAIIIKLNNAQLNLSNGRDFLQENLGAGVNSLSVKSVGEKEVEVKIFGENKLPNVERIERICIIVY